MSYHSSAQIKTVSASIADIDISAAAGQAPRAIGEILRPFMRELRRSRMTGEPMRQEIVDRFSPPSANVAGVAQ